MASATSAAPAAAATSSTFKHTCLNCCVRFSDAAMWRDHYKTDWHRYNLKRSVAELAPVTADEFAKRIQQQRDLAAAGSAKDAQYCEQCRKQFGTAKSYENHLGSRAHRDNVERHAVQQQVAEQVAEQEAELDRLTEEKNRRPAIDPEDEEREAKALDSDDLPDDEDNDEDFEEIDSDEWDDCDDDEDAESVADRADRSYENPVRHNKCLFCGQRSASLVANLTHMSTVHSFFVPDTEYVVDMPGLLRYLGAKVARDFICLWCNDRGRMFMSLDACRKHMRDKGHCKMLHEGLALAEYAKYYDYSSSYPDNNDDMDIDEEIEPEQLEGDEFQMVLPSGAVIGHRSLMRYYKQRLNPQRALVPATKTSKKLHRVLAEYRALGWTQTLQAEAKQKARDIHVMKRTYQRMHMRLGVKGNKLQRHFRLQVEM